MKTRRFIFVLQFLLTGLMGCAGPNDDSARKWREEVKLARAEATQAQAELAKVRAELAKLKGDAKDPRVNPARVPADDMVTSVKELAQNPIEDYRDLPNCLDVLRDCVAMSFEGKTDEQYQQDVGEIATTPCRVVLKVVNISAEYDLADFELVDDNDQPALPALKDAGNLGNYHEGLTPTLPLSDVKKKGLHAKELSVGDRVVIVGLGRVVHASPWGASTSSKRLPRGDERYVMLRAFGKPNNYRKHHYEFAFMVTNWYIASQ